MHSILPYIYIYIYTYVLFHYYSQQQKKGGKEIYNLLKSPRNIRRKVFLNCAFANA